MMGLILCGLISVMDDGYERYKMLINKINTLLKTRLDDRLTNYILNKYSFFKHVSPNFITLFGFILNFVIYALIIHGLFFAGCLMLFLRYLADCLDGGVARKYNKKSKFGGLFDTISDSVLIFLSTLIIFELYDLKYGLLFALLIMFLNIYVMAKIDSLVDHAGMKNSGSFLKNIYAFSVNNSFLLFIAKIIIIYCSIL